MEPGKPYLDIQAAVHEIRDRVQAQMIGSPAPAPSGAVREHKAGGTAPEGLASLREAARRVKRTASLLGQLPPQPPGIRGYVGATLVRMVKRMLFWYTPQIQQFQWATAQAIEEQVSACRKLTEQLHALAEQLEAESQRPKIAFATVERQVANPQGESDGPPVPGTARETLKEE
jgi:hypothetical protein